VLIVPLDEAREGMKLAAPIGHPDNPGQTLLRAGFVLEPAVLQRMREMGIAFVYVEYPALAGLTQHLAVYLSPARQQVLKQITASMERAQKGTRPGISYEDYCTSTRELIGTLMLQGQNPVYLEQMSRQGGDAVAHAAAVAHLSLLLGLKLDHYLVGQRSRLPASRAKDVVNLGIAGMLHDIGVTQLPKALQDCAEPDAPADDAARGDWECHAEMGYDLIRSEVEATVAATVYQHHQHFNGTGFPVLRSAAASGAHQPLAGEKIHVFARIIFCANLFDRLVNPVAGNVRRSNLEAHRLLAGQYKDWCDPAVLKMLQVLAPPYPPGTRLKLSDGSAAIVTGINPAQPLRPLVRRLDKDNWTLIGAPLDLCAADAPAIA
jgi:HD-GYP domain-containing protein (c-di-GMP phosphodiesterase class II)